MEGTDEEDHHPPDGTAHRDEDPSRRWGVSECTRTALAVARNRRKRWLREIVCGIRRRSTYADCFEKEARQVAMHRECMKRFGRDPCRDNRNQTVNPTQ